jgi:hypothetical protein
MAIADRARDFWDRISPRERMLVVALAVAAPITIAVWLGFAISDGLTEMEHRNDRTRQALDVLADQRARGQLKAPVDDVVATMGNEPIDIDTYITNAAKKAKFEIGSLNRHTPVTRNGFVTSTSSTRIDKMSIDQLKDFLTALETERKDVAVTHLDINTRDKDQLTVDVEVSSYSKEPPAKDGGGSGSGSAGGSGSGSGKGG